MKITDSRRRNRIRDILETMDLAIMRSLQNTQTWVKNFWA